MRAATGCWRSPRSARCGWRSARAASSAPTTSSPCTWALSIFEDARGHGTRGFDIGWRDRVLAAWAEAETEAGPLRDGGVYWQALGPRFETPAEIRLIAAHADVVGMTLAAECIVAAELGLPYAAICVVDNLANGIGEEPLSLAEFEAGREASAAAAGDGSAAPCPPSRGGAGLSLTVLGADLDGTVGGVRCEDGRIAEIGPGVAAREGDEVIEAGGARWSPPSSMATPTRR